MTYAISRGLFFCCGITPDEELFFSVFVYFEDRKSSSIITKDASIVSERTIKKGKKPILEPLVFFKIY